MSWPSDDLTPHVEQMRADAHDLASVTAGWLTPARWDHYITHPNPSAVIHRQYAVDLSPNGNEALAELTIHEDGTTTLRAVLFEGP